MKNRTVYTIGGGFLEIFPSRDDVPEAGQRVEITRAQAEAMIGAAEVKWARRYIKANPAGVAYGIEATRRPASNQAPQAC